MSASCKCCVLSGGGLCDGPITRPEETYRVYLYVSLSVIGCKNNPLHLQWVGRRAQTENDRKVEELILIYNALRSYQSSCN
jgi:hypothetical protein